jgi:hypothetical protein
MSAMLAKRMGRKGYGAYPAPRYVDLVQGSVIRFAISRRGDHLGAAGARA